MPALTLNRNRCPACNGPLPTNLSRHSPSPSSRAGGAGLCVCKRTPFLIAHDVADGDAPAAPYNAEHLHWLAPTVFHICVSATLDALQPGGV